MTTDGALAAVSLALAMRSADEGARWASTAAAKGGSSLKDAVLVPGGALVAVGRAGTILRSNDGGQSWVAVVPAGRSDRLLDVAAGVNGVLVAVGENGAIMRSTNDGQSWAAVPDTGSNEMMRRVLAQRTGPWIAAGQLGVILTSATGGLTWQRAHVPPGNNELHDLVAAGPPGVLVAVGDGGTILRSEDGGWNWTPAPPVTEKGLSRVIAHRKVLVAVGDGGTILRSTDTGKTWTPAASGNSGGDAPFSAIASSGDALLAGSADGNIVRSIDLGNNFVPVESRADLLEHIVAGRNSTLVAIGTRLGINPGITVVRSEDGGLGWTLVPMHALSSMTLANIVVEPGGVMLGLGRGILRSIDDGASWSEVKDTSFKTELTDGVSARDGRFVAVGDEGIIVRENMRRAAPTIRRVIHAYDLAGTPVLRISLADPDKLCQNGGCLSAFARTQLDKDRGKPGDRQAAFALLGAGGSVDEYELKIDAKLAATNQPNPLYVNFVVDVPGHHRLYQDKPGVDFTVPNNPTPFWKQTWFRALMLLFGLLLVLMLIVAIRPLLLLRLMVVQNGLSEHGVSGLPGHALTLLVKIVLPILSTQPRVLNAWVDRYAQPLAAAFDEAAKKLSDTSPYWALPVTGPDGAQLIPKPETLAEFFKPKRVFVDIVGQGGAGKTRLALQICNWLAGNRLIPHPAAALLIDEEFSDVLAVVDGKLRAALGNDAPTAAFLKVLLTRGRLWIVIDRVSERQQSTRIAVTRIYQSISPKVVICTSRLPTPLDGAPKISLVPQPLDPDTLLDFVLEHLRAAGARHLFPDPLQLVRFINDMAPHLSGRPDTPRVTPLLVTIVVTQAIESARAHGTAALQNLPRNVPEIYFSYVQRLDETRQDRPSVPGIAPGALIRLAASIIACAELGEDFRPKRVDDAKVNQALMADARIQASHIDFIDRFEQNGLLSRRTVGTESSVEYLLDPLAECLAAYVHARACGAVRERWEALLQQVAAQGEGAQGFIAALRMNHEAYAVAFGFPPVAFAPAA